MLLTSLAFGIAAVTLARRNVLVQELPAVEGLARVDVVCLDKTGTLTEGDVVFDRLEPSRRAVDAAESRRCARRARGRREPQRHAGGDRRGVRAARVATHGRRAVLVGAQVVRRELRRPGHVGHRRARDDPRRRTVRRPGPPPRRRARGRRAAACSCSRAPTRRSTARRCRHVSSRSALVLLEEKVRPDAADTLRYFAEQGVDAEGHLRRQPAHGRRGRAPGRAAQCRRAVRRARPPRGPGRARRRARGALGVRPGHPAAEAGDGRARSSRAATWSR